MKEKDQVAAGSSSYLYAPAATSRTTASTGHPDQVRVYDGSKILGGLGLAHLHTRILDSLGLCGGNHQACLTEEKAVLERHCRVPRARWGTKSLQGHPVHPSLSLVFEFSPTKGLQWCQTREWRQQRSTLVDLNQGFITQLTIIQDYRRIDEQTTTFAY